MENVHATDHCRLTHKWKTVYSPRDTADLRIHLNQNLANNTAQIFAFLDSANKYNLRRNWELLKQEALHVIVKRALALLPWKQEHYHLDANFERLLELLSPVVRLH